MSNLFTRVTSRTTLILWLSCVVAGHLAHADWPSWRGAQDHGSIATGDYPAEFNARTIRWQAPLPGKGCSTPIVVDRVIYVTAPVDGLDALLAFDWSGQLKWVTKFGPEVVGKHRNGSGSNASPVSDGQAIYVYYKSGTLAAVELDGTVRWRTNLVQQFGPAKLFWDHGTSPVVTQRHLVFTRMHDGDSWLAAFDKQSGEIAWKVARNYTVPVENDQCYTTPLVIQHQGRESLLVWGAEHLTIHDAGSGEVVWSCSGFNPDANKLWPAIATPVIVNGVAVIAYGRNDKGAPRLYGVRLEGSGDVTETNHVWFRDDISTFVPTPVAYDGHVYLVRDRGQVECLDPATGKTVWSDAFPKGRSNFYASPLIAGGKLYAPREDGTVFVASVVDGKFELLAENDLGEPVIGSPVPAENRLFIRGEKHLYCLELPRATN
jgi:outer membrane protein assembly factor BamB